MQQSALRGVVIMGAGRGRGLGYPTANLDTSSPLLPKSGIYAVWARIEGEGIWRPGAANIGYNPTFEGRIKKLEVHLLDYDGDLYGKVLEVVPVACLRDERLFSDKEELIAQMVEDCQQARRLLGRTAHPEEDITASWEGRG